MTEITICYCFNVTKADIERRGLPKVSRWMRFEPIPDWVGDAVAVRTWQRSSGAKTVIPTIPVSTSML